MLYRNLSFVVLLGTVVSAQPAFASVCALRADVVKKLETSFSETLTAGGLQGSTTKQTFVEVWTSPENGTFTVILTSPQGVSCVVAAGTNWFQTIPVVKDKSIPG